MAKEYEITRDVTKSECHWLDKDWPAGSRVFRYTGPTYGCVSPRGIAVSEKPDETPFFEVPRDAVQSSE